MEPASEHCYPVPFTADSSLATGLHVLAALGGGAPHRFLLDTGSVGILVPRLRLGPDYQDFDPAQDTTFQYVSSGNVYSGQWVRVPVILGVPETWDGSGDYPTAHVEVFAVDQPADFDGGVFGVGFAIGGQADGGPARNPLLHLSYLDRHLRHGYIISTQAIEAGLTAFNTTGFAFASLSRDDDEDDWLQPRGRLTLPGGFSIDLPILLDTGITKMLIWLDADDRPPALAGTATFPAGIQVTISVPPADAALHYQFVTGDTNQPMAPSQVEWRNGNGINTGRNVLAGTAYLYDALAGRIGFRPTSPPQ